MRYLHSPFCDAYLNMALEEYVFESLPREDNYFMLWQNKNAVVVGKYQNTVQEINADYVREQGIQVVRRLSGGGAMYQDMGNLNFTFVVDQSGAGSLDFSLFTRPVVNALRQLGVPAEAGDRNDILVDGKKISGNSQYNRNGRTMHHGTLLFNSNLEVIQNALNVKAEKIQSKGIKSVRSRVTNILEHSPRQFALAEFEELLLAGMFSGGLKPYTLSEADLAAVEALSQSKYATWEWNYGKNPPYSLRRETRFPFGSVQIDLDVEKGVICGIRFTGDFFGNGDISALASALTGAALQPQAVLAAVEGVNVADYIKGMAAEELAHLICP